MKGQTYMCPECGLHYRDKQTAEACEAFCGQYKACSIEITNHSIEAEEQTV